MSSNNKWPEHWLKIAEVVSEVSKDRSTKVGAVIVGPNNEVLSTGYNGFPRGCNDEVEERHERPEKYFWTEHAERNAIYNASRNGIRLEGSTLYCTLLPCMDCARAIVQSGIKCVVTRGDIPAHIKGSEQWKESFLRTDELFEECKVELDLV